MCDAYYKMPRGNPREVRAISEDYKVDPLNIN